MDQTKKRDGLAIIEIKTKAEVHFVACAYDGKMRERVLSGLLRNMDTDRFYVEDTRDAAPESRR